MEKNMKKRLIALASAALMVVSLVGCGAGNSAALSNDYVSINKYKGLEIEKVAVQEVTDQLIDQIINNQLAQDATSEEVTDRPVQDGDTVDIDFAGFVDGEAFDGGTGNVPDLLIGSNTFIGATDTHQGFEEQLIGHKVGDEFTIEIQFPEPYFNEELAGVVATFDVTINAISRVTTPELNDQWVQTMSDTATTVDEYRAQLRQEQEDRNQQTADAQLQSAVMRALMEQVELKQFPEGAIDEEIQMMVTYYQNMAVDYGMDFEDFTMQFMGLSEEDFHSTVAIVAEDSVKERLAVELIADKEGLNLTDEEYAERIAGFADIAGFENVDIYIEMFGEGLIRSTILRMVVSEWLVEHAKLVDPAAVETPEVPGADIGHVHDENCNHD